MNNVYKTVVTQPSQNRFTTQRVSTISNLCAKWWGGYLFFIHCGGNLELPKDWPKVSRYNKNAFLPQVLCSSKYSVWIRQYCLFDYAQKKNVHFVSNVLNFLKNFSLTQQNVENQLFKTITNINVVTPFNSLLKHRTSLEFLRSSNLLAFFPEVLLSHVNRVTDKDKG